MFDPFYSELNSLAIKTHWVGWMMAKSCNNMYIFFVSFERDLDPTSCGIVLGIRITSELHRLVTDNYA